MDLERALQQAASVARGLDDPVQSTSATGQAPASASAAQLLAGLFTEISSMLGMLQEHTDLFLSTKATLSQRIRELLHSVVSIQGQVKWFKQQRFARTYAERAGHAAPRFRSFSLLVQLPHAYIQTLREFSRRRKFAREYTTLAELVRSKMDTIRYVDMNSNSNSSAEKRTPHNRLKVLELRILVVRRAHAQDEPPHLLPLETAPCRLCWHANMRTIMTSS